MRRFTSRLFLLAAGFGVALFVDSSSAQVFGPLLPKSTAQVGVQVSWVRRDLENAGSWREVDQSRASVPFRCAITEFATISAELMVADQRLHSLERDLRYYVLGGAVQALLWRNDDYLLSGSIGFVESYLVDKVGSACDEDHWSVSLTLQLQRSFQWRRYTATLWGGSLISTYHLIREGGAVCKEFEWADPNYWGAVLGMNLTMFRHYEFYFNFSYQDYFQPRMGAMYRF